MLQLLNSHTELARNDTFNESRKYPMAQSFSLGIRQIWEELSVMQSPGLYWVNIDRQTDAGLLCQQTLAAQAATSKAALICSGEKPDRLLAELASPALKKLPLYQLPEKKAALMHLSDDLMRALKPRNRLLILLAHASLWQTFTTEELRDWSRAIAGWLRRQGCTLLILSHGSGVNKLKGQLSAQHRILNGLSSLQWQQDSAQYLVNWWSTENGINANQLLTLYAGERGWQGDEDGKKPSPTAIRSDEGHYLAERSILEGAPPLSANWQLLDSNAQLAQHGMLTLSATLIFALYQSDQIDALAHQIHGLRRSRGSGLKIAVREMSASLRYSDERLLLACGANLIVPHVAPLSRFLTMLEGIQGQRFARHVPADIDVLLAGLRPLQLKGYMRPHDFSQAVSSLMGNTLLPEDGKGVMVALRPAPGLRAEQAMTLCHLRRFGDVMTVVQGRLVLFLSTCRINDLDTALKFIFRLPVDEAFSNRVVWHQDVDIISEIKRMAHGGGPAPATEAVVAAPRQKAAAAEDAPERRQPVAFTLATGAQEEKHAEP
ncbi:cellulose biosynthesis protein BcsE [Serratia ficaria]|uniref:Cellulose biosynthesis protein BcsE n=2 Tax=Serratia ficaria TaxID=61651 RepID=A0A240AAT4_SERFI|nr:cellulose biosynthesis protein BcsE [Serratia ficaria]CAI1067749.1 cellulose biosynthesis protein BcsE [Serratia ficaria]CAI1092516.1 cellulose biosynthesis protein BcsE [Serratia ficaria]CAI1094953.1 cellulose biosynthesis protein BcsE [Serratia ficaria]CAI1786680.1 cellulose biosynthesis protein BcsE [Serratia ficaria]